MSLENLVRQEKEIIKGATKREALLWKELADLGITDERISAVLILDESLSQIRCPECNHKYPDLVLHTENYRIYWRIECPKCSWRFFMHNYSFRGNNYYWAELKPRIETDILIARHILGEDN